MCKFTNRLFVFLLIGLYCCCMMGSAAPVIRSADNDNMLLNLFTQYNDRDIHYDQRQRGKENFMVQLDGFFLGFPELDLSGILEGSDAETDWALRGSTIKDVSENQSTDNKHLTLETVGPINNIEDEDAIAEEATTIVEEIDKDLDNSIIVEIPSAPKAAPLESRRAAVEPDKSVELSATSRAKLYFLYFLDLLRFLGKD